MNTVILEDSVEKRVMCDEIFYFAKLKLLRTFKNLSTLK